MAITRQSETGELKLPLNIFLLTITTSLFDPSTRICYLYIWIIEDGDFTILFFFYNPTTQL